MIPGSNILKTALSIIASQTIIYYRYLGRQLNNIGQDVASYDNGTIITGSFQPVPRRLYQIYGLDLQKTYFTLYASVDVLDITRGVSGDQIVFGNDRYQCESNNDWYAIDGWKGVLCVYIDSSPSNQYVFGFNEMPQINNNTNFENGNFKTG